MKTTDIPNTSRRSFITGAGVSTAAALFAPQKLVAGNLEAEPGGQASALPSSPLNLGKTDTAVIFMDPQNDVLSAKGLGWPMLHESLKENNTIENMERIFKAAKAYGFEVFIPLTISFPRTKDGCSTDRDRPSLRRPYRIIGIHPHH